MRAHKVLRVRQAPIKLDRINSGILYLYTVNFVSAYPAINYSYLAQVDETC
jgi:hypothetical protein